MATAHTAPLGWVYIALTAVWTIILVVGMVFLHRHRQLPFLRIRRLPLVFIAIVLLHLFLCAAMAGWTYGPLMPCDVQFWIMSIYLPFGIAMLQAANSQFLHIATKQRKYAHFTGLDNQSFTEKAKQPDPSLRWWRRCIQSIRYADKVTRIVIYIGIAMLVNLALTFFIYFGSEVFHPSYGIFHIEVPGTAEREAMCLVGWEWWLSITWQFFWAWVYAPYMLWKTRNIRDSHGWRTQTILCSIAGLPASPLWLACLYIPEMAPVNAVMIPPQWFAVSIFFIEIFTILFPCWHVFRAHSLKKETLDAIASWEEKRVGGSSVGSTTLTAQTLGSSATPRSEDSKSRLDSRKSDMLTMVALQHALRSNPRALLEFAALKDFSGENVSFILEVSDWKRAWATSKGDTKTRLELFTRAVQIYSHFISLEFSEFPINISSRQAKDLLKTFGDSAQLLNEHRINSDQATPFDSVSPTESTTSLQQTRGRSFNLEATLGKVNLESVTNMVKLDDDDGNLCGPIPDSFSREVFDGAEKEITYLVLTSTWPKFVHTGIENGSQRDSDNIIRTFHVGKYFCGWEDAV